MNTYNVTFVFDYAALTDDGCGGIMDDFICDTCNSWDDDLQVGVCECCRLEDE